MKKLSHPLVKPPRRLLQNEADGRYYLVGGVTYSGGAQQAAAAFDSLDEIPQMLEKIAALERKHQEAEK